jgi:hypothetical protein
MKPLLMFLLLLPATLQAQVIYGSFQPADFGLGVRCDYTVKGLRVYNSLSYGNGGVYKCNDVRNHIKATVGIMPPLPDYNGNQFNLTAGLNYHHIGSAKLEGATVDSKIFNPLSFEMGLAVRIKGFAFAVSTDILRWEPAIYLGLNLNYEK